MKKKILILIVSLLLCGYVIYKYVYKSHRDITSEEASFSLTSDQLMKDYATNELKANEFYLNKTIQLKGLVTHVSNSEKTLVLDKIIFASFDSSIEVKKNDMVILKGRVLGFDNLLQEVKLDQCIIIEKLDL